MESAFVWLSVKRCICQLCVVMPVSMVMRVVRIRVARSSRAAMWCWQFPPVYAQGAVVSVIGIVLVGSAGISKESELSEAAKKATVSEFQNFKVSKFQHLKISNLKISKKWERTCPKFSRFEILIFTKQ